MFWITDFDPQYDFGMKKVDDFIKNIPHHDIKKNSDINVGYVGKTLVFEIPMVGIKKENITVAYSGKVIEVSSTYEADVDIKYVLNKLDLKNVHKKLSLVNEYIGGAVRWKYENGLMTIAVEPYETPSEGISPSESDNFFNVPQNNEDVNVP